MRLRFIRNRVFPSRVAVAELKLAEAAQPALKQVSWYGIPHARRIQRWLFTRPPAHRRSSRCVLRWPTFDPIHEQTRYRKRLHQRTQRA